MKDATTGKASIPFRSGEQSLQTFEINVALLRRKALGIKASELSGNLKRLVELLAPS